MSTPHHWPRPDFFSTGPRRPALAWAWALTGVAVLVVALAEGRQTLLLKEEQGARLARAEARLTRERQRDRATVEPTRTTPSSAADAEAASAAQRVIARLEHPWAPLLANLEAESLPGVQWLGFDHDSASNEVRLEGRVPDAATALALIDHLAARPGWSAVALSRWRAPDGPDVPNPRDARETGPSGALWRFELKAVIDTRRLASAQRPAPS
jgi:hypothetical protein